MGEIAPFDQYAVSHGICSACIPAVRLGLYQATSTTLLAQKIFNAVTFSAPRQGFDLPELFIQEALDAQIKPSELMLGVLSPALYRIGLRWEKGLVTPAEEHDFTAWCEGVLGRFPRKAASADRPTIVLTTLRGNVHTLGVRFLGMYLAEQGFPCRVIVPGLLSEALIEECVSTQPAFCGISVALPEGIDRARSLAQALFEKTKGVTKVFLGGFAFRQDYIADAAFPVLQTAEDLLAFIGKAS